MFDKLCGWVGTQIGKPVSFVFALVIIAAAVAAALVPEWQAAVNMWGGAASGYLSILFLIILQNGQNRQTLANQVQQGELIRALPEARNELIGLEKKDPAEISAAGVRLREEVIRAPPRRPKSKDRPA